jgi:chromosome partitioning protein
MKVVSVFNYKGGVGKTTLTANIGAQLARLGKKVLLIDIDPQASLTFSFIRPYEWSEKFEKNGTIKTWLDSFQESAPIPLNRFVQHPAAVNKALASKGKLDIIFSSLDLIDVDRSLAVELIGATIPQCQHNYFVVLSRLADALRNDFSANDYDVVLIDCPPNLSTSTEIGVVASQYFLIPVLADDLATLGINHLFRKVGELVARYNECAELEPAKGSHHIAPRAAGIVFTMIEEHGGMPVATQRQFIAQVKKLPAANVFGAYMKRNSALFAGAPQFGLPVVLHKPRNPTDLSVIEGLKRIASEFAIAIGL